MSAEDVVPAPFQVSGQPGFKLEYIFFEPGRGDIPVEVPVQVDSVPEDVPAGLVAGQVLSEPFLGGPGRLADVYPAVWPDPGADGVSEVDHVDGVDAVALVGVHHVPVPVQVLFDEVHPFSGFGLVGVGGWSTDRAGKTGEEVQAGPDAVCLCKSRAGCRTCIQLFDQFFRVVASVADEQLRAGSVGDAREVGVLDFTQPDPDHPRLPGPGDNDGLGCQRLG